MPTTGHAGRCHEMLADPDDLATTYSGMRGDECVASLAMCAQEPSLPLADHRGARSRHSSLCAHVTALS
eukprot:423928-Prymnesium_polylepis.1